ncbi:fibrillarin-like rRNA/tRNA 2'-O-methyltransferase [Halanaeroarchaeum sulfurireducens]|uniref:Fibrillarin-like rRNA/tRNA 2'-O-methyltransferase n=1 Tax=Halanaeroarchaeum sulfurireducens TaxID=1604004 RepID=A0A0F7PFJ8_9EURY|nr:fibrillarin-like rRNA/tRNA 2'-O-methyltransferase [Halanaeroarchaeum sulfurireducens]AKH98093.1 fibrillarin [Halanaeroarchaeum sulfurireducens]ALG82487.1 fibrillarin [Halanaeroarchaeum sulfurireducens]
MSRPDGVAWHTFDGTRSLATRGKPVYGEQTDGEWRRWDPHRSKLGATFEKGLETGLRNGDSVLYLGAANGTTVSHVADFAGPTYAVEFAPRPARDLVAVARTRDRLFPLLKDARTPETYAHVVESELDAIVQDVATRGQARVANENRRFLADDGRLIAAIKARSEDVTREPPAVFEEVLESLTAEYEVLETERLEPYHDDHLAVVARPL